MDFAELEIRHGIQLIVSDVAQIRVILNTNEPTSSEVAGKPQCWCKHRLA